MGLTCAKRHCKSTCAQRSNTRQQPCVITTHSAGPDCRAHTITSTTDIRTQRSSNRCIGRAGRSLTSSEPRESRC
jgi:hypothetical protein